MLEEENAQLRRRASILDAMLSDIDKQLQVMTDCRQPLASQWMALIDTSRPPGASSGAGDSGVGGTAHGFTDAGAWAPRRRLHLALEGMDAEAAAAVDVQAARAYWQALCHDVRRLIAAVDAADAAAAAAAGCGATSAAPPAPGWGSNATTMATGSNGMLSFTSSASAAVPGGGYPSDCADDSLGMSSSSVTAGQQMPSAAAAAAAAAASAHAELEARVQEGLTWLIGIMVHNVTVVYRFIGVDTVDGSDPLPSESDDLWLRCAEVSALCAVRASLRACHNAGCMVCMRERTQQALTALGIVCQAPHPLLGLQVMSPGLTEEEVSEALEVQVVVSAFRQRMALQRQQLQSALQVGILRGGAARARAGSGGTALAA